MRDPQRIHNFLAQIEAYWLQVPDWRFGQLISNVYGAGERDQFFYEEDETLALFEKVFNPSKTEN